MIVNVQFNDIVHIWQNYLWPNRTSKIESTSAMCFLGNYDLENMKSNPTFFAYKINGEIAGVNSGHFCKADDSYRSRGLFVFNKYRNQGIGTSLLLATIEQAIRENANLVWSYPRISSWNTYNKAGFELASNWEPSELGKNAYCSKKLFV